MIILDANVWVAYLNENDSQHKKAVEVFSDLDQSIIITEYLILEVVSVIASRVDKRTADQFLEVILNNQDIKVMLSSQSFFTNTVSHFKNFKSNTLSFVDLSLLYLAENHEIITFDKHLQRALKSTSRPPLS